MKRSEWVKRGWFPAEIDNMIKDAALENSAMQDSIHNFDFSNIPEFSNQMRPPSSSEMIKRAARRVNPSDSDPGEHNINVLRKSCIEMQFPEHDHKAAMESYVTKGSAEQEGILYTRARNHIRFGFQLVQNIKNALYYEFKIKLR